MQLLSKIICQLLAPFFLLILSLTCTGQELPKKPNIIYILADDLGYGELGCYGQNKIETPNIDQLASEGIMFTQHYSGAPVCAPSRCMLLTGKHAGHAQIRGNDEWKERGDVWNYYAQVQDSTLEGQRPLKTGTITLANCLKDAGYNTALIGKWGLGAPHTKSTPLQMGFDFFVGYNCQRQAHTYYPVHLYKNDKRLLLRNDTIAPVEKLAKGANPSSEESYSKFTLNDYSCDVMFEELQGFIIDNDPRKQQKPFFMYWATPIPHVPLQAPERWVNYYISKFGNEEPYNGKKGYFPNQYPRATYAAMVSHMDEQIGMLIKQLKAMDIYNNTIIVFSSDNGPTYTGGADSKWFNSGGPFASEYGRGKGFTHEGGIRVPMIATWPGVIPENAKSDHISAFWDVLPTFCEIGGGEVPENIDGISFLPSLIGEDKQQKEHDFLYWEFPSYGGQQAVRMGNWKGIRKNILKGNLKLELYNLENDIREEHDVAFKYPKIVKKIEEIMRREHEPAENERFKMKQIGD